MPFSDTIVFETDLVRIGAFRCDADYSGFQDTGPASGDCFVFPRTAVQIEHEHQPPFAANPNVVTFYNRSQRYQRREISDRGDQCDWFGVDRALALDVVRTFDASADEAPFGWGRGPCDARTYLWQRRLFDGVGKAGPAEVEEQAIFLLERVVAQLFETRPREESSVSNRKTVHEAECLIGKQFDQPLSLAAIARCVGSSVYHLCRTFRLVTGMALHQYRRQLRVRNGLERICESDQTLSGVAVDLGYAHHSHFTSAFRREFGCTPSELRSGKDTPAEVETAHPRLEQT